MTGISRTLLTVTYGILGFLFLTIFLNASALLIGGTVKSIFVVAAVVLATAGVYVMSKHQRQSSFKTVLIFLAAISISIGFSMATTDLSWDGNSYHKTAIGAMKDGWNPVWQDINTFNADSENTFRLQGEKGLDRAYDTLWVDHYPKAAWLYAASMYAVTGSIESGKSLALLLLLAVFFASYAFIRQRLSRNNSLIVAGIAALSPVAIAQLSSYYNDGILGSLMALLFIFLTMLIDRNAKTPGGDKALYAGIAVVIVIASNVKFTGLAFAGIIMACYWLYMIMRRDWRRVIRVAITGIIALALGIGIVGASSYIKNTASTGNPLYPLIGKGSVDFISINQPLNIADKPRIYKFIVTNLVGPTAQISNSQPEYYRYLHPKIPFSIAMDELRFLPGVDTRQGGYGVWFGGILILSVLFGGYALLRYGRNNKKNLALFLLPIIAMGIAAIALDGSWWARYLPFLPLLPVIVVVALLLSKEKVLSAILVFALLFNVTLLGALSISEQMSTQKANLKQIESSINCRHDRPTHVFSAGRLDGALYNLRDTCPTILPVSPSEFDRWKATALKLPNDIYVKVE